MAEPTTPGEARRQGLRRTRWVAAGVSVGAAVLLTGTIAVVNAAPSNASSPASVATVNGQVGSGNGYSTSGDDYGNARTYTPPQYTPPQYTPQQQQQQPSYTPLPQTRTRGS